MGFNGVGHVEEDYNFEVNRDLNAIPFLAYYEIAKQHYCNKQEEKAYVISTKISESVITKVVVEPEGYTTGNDGNPYSESDRRTSGSRYDGTNRAVTPTAKTYTGDGLLKVKIPINSKVYIYFENAYINSNLSYSTRQINPSSLTSYMGFNGLELS